MAETQLLLFDPPRPLVERFGEAFFRAIPERPGVYFLCGESSVLYVGKAANLRRRLGSYRVAHPERHSRKIFRLLFRVTRIYWDECADEAAARERERRLLLVLQPKFNTAGVYPPPMRVLGTEEAQRSKLQAQGKVHEPSPDSRAPGFFGLLAVFPSLARSIGHEVRRFCATCNR